MDAVSVQKDLWDGSSHRLTLQCVPEREESYTIAVPKRFCKPELQCRGAEGRLVQEGSILTLIVKGKESLAEIKINYSVGG